MDRTRPHHFAGRTGRAAAKTAELQQKFSEIKRSINNALAVMMALSKMSQRRPNYAEKLATTVTTVSTNAPQIVSSLQEFTQALNAKAAPKPEVAAGENQ